MYCKKCGAEIMQEAVICPKCGCYTENKSVTELKTEEAIVSGLKTAAKIFMIISCIVMGFWLIPLTWTIPMTTSYCNKIKNGQPVSVGFKICTLLFVNVIAGILMLCDKD